MPEYLLPDVGEGLTEAEIVTWKVKVGDEVAINDVVVEIETAKSLVELPSPYAGTVTALLVGEGETVPVGTPIIAIGEPVDSPGSPILMIGVPTGTVSPSGTSRSSTVPAYGDGSSTSDLAVSISTTMSLTLMTSPTLTFQVTISASVRPSPTSGSLNCFMGRGS